MHFFPGERPGKQLCYNDCTILPFIKTTLSSPEKAIEISQKEGFAYLVDMIKVVQTRYREEDTYDMWNIAREAPRAASEYNDERVVQMIDEFQFINRYIYQDKLATSHRINNLAGSYLHTCEYKTAPLLVAGSWVGWLMDDLSRTVPSMPPGWSILRWLFPGSMKFMPKISCFTSLNTGIEMSAAKN